MSFAKEYAPDGKLPSGTNERDFDGYMLRQMYKKVCGGNNAKSDDGFFDRNDNDKDNRTEDEEFALTHESMSELNDLEDGDFTLEQVTEGPNLDV